MPEIHEVATLTSKGQITLPKEVRDSLSLKEGDRVSFVVEADGSVLYNDGLGAFGVRADFPILSQTVRGKPLVSDSFFARRP